MLSHWWQCKKNWKIFPSLKYKLFWALQWFWMFRGLLFQIKLHLLCYSVDFKALQELWNPLSKAVPGKFHGSGGHSKHKCLHAFHGSQAWQIVLTLNSADGRTKVHQNHLIHMSSLWIENPFNISVPWLRHRYTWINCMIKPHYKLFAFQKQSRI